MPASPPLLEGLLSVAEFEAAARAVLPPAHFGFLATGVDDDRTVAWNHEAYGQLEISVRRFADVTHTDLGVELFGTHWPSPVYLSAVGSQRAFHPEAELATARCGLALGADDAVGRRLDRAAGRDGRAWRTCVAADLPHR